MRAANLLIALVFGALLACSSAVSNEGNYLLGANKHVRRNGGKRSALNKYEIKYSITGYDSAIVKMDEYAEGLWSDFQGIVQAAKDAEDVTLDMYNTFDDENKAIADALWEASKGLRASVYDLRKEYKDGRSTRYPAAMDITPKSKKLEELKLISKAQGENIASQFEKIVTMSGLIAGTAKFFEDAANGGDVRALPYYQVTAIEAQIATMHSYVTSIDSDFNTLSASIEASVMESADVIGILPEETRAGLDSILDMIMERYKTYTINRKVYKWGKTVWYRQASQISAMGEKVKALEEIMAAQHELVGGAFFTVVDMTALASAATHLFVDEASITMAALPYTSAAMVAYASAVDYYAGMLMSDYIGMWKEIKENKRALNYVYKNLVPDEVRPYVDAALVEFDEAYNYLATGYAAYEYGKNVLYPSIVEMEDPVKATTAGYDLLYTQRMLVGAEFDLVLKSFAIAGGVGRLAQHLGEDVGIKSYDRYQYIGYKVAFRYMDNSATALWDDYTTLLTTNADLEGAIRGIYSSLNNQDTKIIDYLVSQFETLNAVMADGKTAYEAAMTAVPMLEEMKNDSLQLARGMDLWHTVHGLVVAEFDILMGLHSTIAAIQAFVDAKTA